MDQVQWLESLIKQYSKALIRYAFNILKDVEAAKDVVQECFLKLMQQDQSKVQIPGWLYRETRNRSIDIWRKRRKVDALKEEDEEKLSSDGPNPLEGLELKMDSENLMNEISKLSKRDQEILRLKYTEGLSYQQIAEAMDLTATNVGFILSQVLKNIRESMGQSRERAERKHGE